MCLWRVSPVCFPRSENIIALHLLLNSMSYLKQNLETFKIIFFFLSFLPKCV